ncbi:complement C1q tumor necrosis factor-related protein 2-like [Mytilus californianus]|uniref:complement C1q tumor necrosis factor-related protein 2-like n=1 Tax=Mytilus californianus TaxID=6549 RepID=UPI0022460049|nr:complement C1q tumor necrosis factor-related protein 2-like [Mytilus californianus]
MSLTSMLISWIVVFYMITFAGATTSCRTADGQYDVIVNYRGKTGPETPKSRVIAFYAFMSKSITSPGVGRRLVFDVMKTNQGGGYNSHTGVFTCPKTGTYVFVWVVRLGSAYHSFELMINNSVYGSTHLYNNGTGGSVSGTVVAHVSKGESVYVRAHSSYKGSGVINSDTNGRTAFSGWLLN